MEERCPRCGLHFERVEGHWIGAIGINTIVSFGLLLIVTVVGLFATYPDPPVAPLTAAGMGVALLAPIVVFPISRTFWTAIDICMRPLQPDDFPQDSEHVDHP